MPYAHTPQERAPPGMCTRLGDEAGLGRIVRSTPLAGEPEHWPYYAAVCNSLVSRISLGLISCIAVACIRKSFEQWPSQRKLGLGW